MKLGRQTAAISAAAMVMSFALIGAGKTQKSDSEPVFVFALTNYGTRPQIDPVVSINTKGIFAEPLGKSEAVTDAKVAAFVRRHLKVGTDFRVLFGGKLVGTATVKAPPGDPGISLETPVTLQSSIPINNMQQALAVAGGTQLRGERSVSLRQPAASGNQSSALAVAQSALAKKGVITNAAQIKAVYVVPVQLDTRQKQHGIVGQFRADVGGNRHEMLLIAEPNRSGSGYSPGYIWHNKSVRDSDDGSHVAQIFVDACDLNGDGIAEIVVRSLYYESHDYTIYQKKRGGVWRAVYRGAGGGL